MILPGPGWNHTDGPELLNCTFTENWFKFVLSYQRLVWCCQALLCIYHQRNNRYQQELEWKAVDWAWEFKEVFLLVVLLLFDQRQNTRDEPVVLEPPCPWANSSSHFAPCWYFADWADQGTDPDNVSDKSAVELIGRRSWASSEIRDGDAFKKAPTKGPLLMRRVVVRCIFPTWLSSFPSVMNAAGWKMFWNFYSLCLLSFSENELQVCNKLQKIYIKWNFVGKHFCSQ